MCPLRNFLCDCHDIIAVFTDIAVANIYMDRMVFEIKSLNMGRKENEGIVVLVRLQVGNLAY